MASLPFQIIFVVFVFFFSAVLLAYALYLKIHNSYTRAEHRSSSLRVTTDMKGVALVLSSVVLVLHGVFFILPKTNVVFSAVLYAFYETALVLLFVVLVFAWMQPYWFQLRNSFIGNGLEYGVIMFFLTYICVCILLVAYILSTEQALASLSTSLGFTAVVYVLTFALLPVVVKGLVGRCRGMRHRPPGQDAVSGYRRSDGHP